MNLCCKIERISRMSSHGEFDFSLMGTYRFVLA